MNDILSRLDKLEETVVQLQNGGNVNEAYLEYSNNPNNQASTGKTPADKTMIFTYELDVNKVAVFVGGVLFGTAGLKVLGSKDAKKVYTQGTAAVLRAKDCVMQATTTVQENAEDILAEAKQINEERYAMEKNSVETAEEADAE